MIVYKLYEEKKVIGGETFITYKVSKEASESEILLDREFPTEYFDGDRMSPSLADFIFLNNKMYYFDFK